MTLKDALPDWTDFDLATHALAVALGVFPAGSRMNEHKAVYWSNNPLGRELWKVMRRLVRCGVLEYRDEPDLQYRWNKESPHG